MIVYVLRYSEPYDDYTDTIGVYSSKEVATLYKWKNVKKYTLEDGETLRNPANYRIGVWEVVEKYVEEVD